MHRDTNNNLEEHPIVNELRQILLHHWDPIGICDVASMADEYDSYLHDLLILAESTHTQIEDYRDELLCIEHDFMGLDADIEQCTQAAILIHALALKYRV